jgi:hypothetical protein
LFELITVVWRHTLPMICECLARSSSSAGQKTMEYHLLIYTRGVDTRIKRQSFNSSMLVTSFCIEEG